MQYIWYFFGKFGIFSPILPGHLAKFSLPPSEQLKETGKQAANAETEGGKGGKEERGVSGPAKSEIRVSVPLSINPLPPPPSQAKTLGEKSQKEESKIEDGDKVRKDFF